MSLLSNSDNQIPLYTTTSRDWHVNGEDANYAVDLNVGVNEYIFGRTTPDNKFVVSTGLVTDSKNGIEMTGGGYSTKNIIKKGKKSIKKIKSSIGSFISKIQDSLKEKSSVPKKKTVKKSTKPVTTVKSSVPKKKTVKKSTKPVTTVKSSVPKKKTVKK
jgi:hypothetical protein